MLILVFNLLLACRVESNELMVLEAHAKPLYTPQFAALPEQGLDIKSEYSHILIKDKGSQRSLYFVRDSGEVVLESSVDMSRPYDLMVPYTQVMMAAQLYRPKAQNALMVGVGGGGMLHYFQAYFPQLNVDAVDIDPAIIDVAQRYFALSAAPSLELHTADGFLFIEKGDKKYDIIFMDAFLKPSVDTDPTGTHLRLKTLSFYEQLKNRLNPAGVVAFNINPHPTVERDIATIREAFSQVWVVPVPSRGNTIVLASTQKEKITSAQLEAAAQAFDSTLKTSLSYQGLSDLVQRSAP